MKKLLSVVLCTVLLSTMMAGCTPKTPPAGSGSGSASDATSSATGSQPQGDDARPLVNLTMINGPTGIGAAQLLSENDAEQTANRYEVTIAAANDEVTTALIQGSTDIAALSTSVAANLYAKSDSSIQVLAVNTLGVLYILEKGDSVHELSDLSGQTVYATGQGANPEYILRYLLEKSGVALSSVNIEWMTPQEVTAKMAASDNAICMLPVPAATALLEKDGDVRQALSLSDEWDAVGARPLPMGCVVVRKDFAEKNQQAVADFLAEYEASLAFMSSPENLSAASQLAVDYGFIANNTIAAAALPQCNLYFTTGEEMKLMLENYYQVMFQFDHDSIGGAMPYDSFYYGVA